MQHLRVLNQDGQVSVQKTVFTMEVLISLGKLVEQQCSEFEKKRFELQREEMEEGVLEWVFGEVLVKFFELDSEESVSSKEVTQLLVYL